MHFCDSMMCITGHLSVILNPDEKDLSKIYTFADLLSNADAGYDSLIDLAYPLFNGWNATPEQACIAIDNYIAGRTNPWNFLDKGEE